MSDSQTRSSANYTEDGLFPVEVENLLRRLGLDDPVQLPSDVLPTSPAGYLLESEIGRGGMGIVYRAAQTKLKRTVAIKMMRFTQSPVRSLNRFFLEAETLALIHHPNVVPIYDFGDSIDGSFIVLEYLPGGSLARRLKARGPMPIPDAVKLIRTLAHALQAVHDVGIVHRDLKPSNILFTTDDTPKITDFGLAKGPSTAALTVTQTYLGTPVYMSTEQAEGKTRFVGPESDIYSLGVVLYECLTGKTPFTHDQPWQLLRLIVEAQPPSPRVIRPEIPRELERIVMKCLEKQPHRRYSSATSLADDLLRLQEGRPVLAKPSGTLARAGFWIRSHPFPSLLALISIVSAFSLTGTAIHSYETRSRLRQQELLTEQRQTERLLAEETARLREAESRLARVDANRAEELAELLASIFRPSVAFPSHAIPQLTPWEIVRQTTAEDLLADAVRRLDDRWTGDPLTRAKVQLVLGEALLVNGSFEDARPNLENALTIQREQLPKHHPDTMRTVYAMARFWDDTGDFAKSLELYREVATSGSPKLQEKARAAIQFLAIALDPTSDLPTFENEPRSDGERVNQTVGYLHRAMRFRFQGQLREAGQAIRRGHEKAVLIPAAAERGICSQRLNLESFRIAVTPQRIPEIRQLISESEGILGEGNAIAALARSELAMLLPDEAESLFRMATNDLRRTISLAHPITLPHIVRVANWHSQLRQSNSARAIMEEAGRAHRDRYRYESAHTVAWLIERAILEEQLGDPDAAAGFAEEAIQIVARANLWLPIMTCLRRDQLVTRLVKHEQHRTTTDQLRILGTVPPNIVKVHHE